MRSTVLIFVPCGKTPTEMETALRKHVDLAEGTENPTAISSEPVEDAEQLPLWKWFTFDDALSRLLCVKFFTDYPARLVNLFP